MILMKKEDATCKLQDLYILRYELADVQETFNYPISLKEVGIVVGSTFVTSKEIFLIKDVDINVFYYMLIINYT